MGTVYRSVFFPRWRVRFVMYCEIGPSPVLCEGVWWRTQEQAEEHALGFLDGQFSFSAKPSEFYDIQYQERPEDVSRT